MSNSKNQWQYRYDTVKFKHYEFDNVGNLRFVAPISREGDLRYYNADTHEFYDEYVSERTLIDSLDSCKTKAITLLHPDVKVTPSNSRQHSRGLTGHSGFYSNGFLWLTGTATDQELIERATRGDCKELSLGYDAWIAMQQSKRHQAKRDGNHLAFVPKGRAGRKVALRMDSTDDTQGIITVPYVEYYCDDDTLDKLSVPDQMSDYLRGTETKPVYVHRPNADTNASSDAKETIMPTLISIGDQVYSVDGNDAPALKEAVSTYVKTASGWKEKADSVATKDSEITTLQTRVTALEKDKARVDGELLAAQTKLDDVTKKASNNDAVDNATAIKERMSLWGEVLPAIRKNDKTYNADWALDVHSIKREYLTRRCPDMKDKLTKLDMTDPASQVFLDGLYAGLKPDVKDNQTTNHSDNVLDMINRTTGSNSTSTSTNIDNEDGDNTAEAQARQRLRDKLEGKKEAVTA